MSNPLEQTIAEKMKLSEREIANRKQLFGLTDEDETLLLDSKPIFALRINDIIEDFYAQQTAVPEVATIIGDKDSLERLKTAMRRYVMDLFGGEYGAEYVNSRLRIGLVHKRIGVFPHLYMSGVRLLLNVLLAELNHYPDLDLRELRISALEKIIFFDAHLVFDTYISNVMSELNKAKMDLEIYAESLEEKISDRTRQLKKLSMTDELTGLYNQRSFYDHLRRELSLADRLQYPVTLIYFDLNGFKKLNDSKGHVVGDRLLSTVGSITKNVVRESDIACRYGGDEFAVIMPRSNTDTAKVVAARLCESFGQTETDGVSFSLGIVEADANSGIDSESLVKLADQAMYEAKALSKTDPGHHIHIADIWTAQTPKTPQDQADLASFAPVDLKNAS